MDTCWPGHQHLTEPLGVGDISLAIVCSSGLVAEESSHVTSDVITGIRIVMVVIFPQPQIINVIGTFHCPAADKHGRVSG